MHHSWRWLLLSIGAWLAPLTTLAASAAPPNVVFILADDLGINDLRCYGRKEHRTPHLDLLAAEGARFTSAYAACWVCSPTRAAVMTGKHPARLHLTTYLPGRPDAPSQKLLQPRIRQELPLEETTLAERLKQAGYATACVGKWHLGGGNFGPEQQGFDFVHAGRANTTPTASEGGKGEFDLTARAEEFIAANQGRPFFLYLCHNSPHVPLGASDALAKDFHETFHPTYAAMMAALDESVGRLLATLARLDLAERTIVVFTSDNGGLHVPEAGAAPPTHNTPFRAGKGFLYEGGIRVPLIVRWPGAAAANRVIDSPVFSTDWYPTLLEACGVREVGEHDGVSLVSLLRKGASPQRALFWHVPHYLNQGGRPAGAVRLGDWKLIEHYEDGSVELYDLAKDPGEGSNVATANPEVARQLREKLAAWRLAVGAQENQLNPNFDPALHRRLYVEVDVSKLRPAVNAELTGAPLADWRQAMNRVVQRK